MYFGVCFESPWTITISGELAIQTAKLEKVKLLKTFFWKTCQYLHRRQCGLHFSPFAVKVIVDEFSLSNVIGWECRHPWVLLVPPASFAPDFITLAISFAWLLCRLKAVTSVEHRSKLAQLRFTLMSVAVSVSHSLQLLQIKLVVSSKVH